MRIPYTISKATHGAYSPSPESLILIGENGRHLLAEDMEWDKDMYPDLSTLCVEAIAANFKNDPIFEILQCHDRGYLLEVLDVDLPLELVVPLIDDEIYYQRCFTARYGIAIITNPPMWTWKSLYIERKIQELLEEAHPETSDEEDLADIFKMCACYVKRLIVTQLQAWKPALHWGKEEIPENWPNDHINFEYVFRYLLEIEEFDLTYGMNNVEDRFTWRMFKVSVEDCELLGDAIHYLQNLRVLKIHNSRLGDDHIRALMQGFIKNETVEELDLSRCMIGDQGAICIAKVLVVHPKLRDLNLRDNKIGQLGCEGLGFALLQESCMLEKLNLKLNPLKLGGAMGILRALVRGTKIVEISMAACQFEREAPIRVGQMLLLNASLKKLDISNNWLDTAGGRSLINGLTINHTLEWLDVRETDIEPQQLDEINALLERNRVENESDEDESIGEEFDEEEQSEETEQSEYLEQTVDDNTDTLATAATTYE